nr:MAG TPA: hypothetical protein [Bacteriophage sp.]
MMPIYHLKDLHPYHSHFHHYLHAKLCYRYM